MKKFSPLLFVASIALSACGAPTSSMTHDESMRNPLYAEYYWNDLVDTLTNIEIDATRKENAEFLKEKGNLDRLHSLKEDALAAAKKERAKRDDGASGPFARDTEETQGFIMLLDNVLYTNPSFNTPPGPSLHIYLSPVVDPRDAVFPDPDATDLGLLQQPYGAQTMVLSKEPAKKPHVVVLYDTVLKRIYGFAQLSYGPNAEL